MSTGENFKTHCAACRRTVKAAEQEEATFDTVKVHEAPSPITQIVFDLETWGLDRGWGVTLVGSFLIFSGNKVETKTITLREFTPWMEGRRSDDREFVAAIFEILKQGHVAYAHNGEFFDMRWLRTVALKYQLEMPKLRLIDPAQIAWKNYRIGRNSLEAIADFLELPYQKYHLSPEVWRNALLDDDDDAWRELTVRCESDVLLLNSVAGAVTRDAGMIDYSGSARR
jgi:uncharacterized protein YprB with RNaseH-like and TPR domain